MELGKKKGIAAKREILVDNHMYYTGLQEN
jgi:hypothetical protein